MTRISRHRAQDKQSPLLPRHCDMCNHSLHKEISDVSGSHGELSSVCMRSANYKRTNTRCLGVVESESGVARYTIRSAVHRATNAGLGNAVVACAYIHCETTAQFTPCKRESSNKITHMLMHAHGYTFKHVRVHAVLAWLSVNPALHDAHFTAPYAGQAVPVAPTPL